jgi:hypothetical protein
VGTELATWPETHDEEVGGMLCSPRTTRSLSPRPSPSAWLAGNQRDVYSVELTINERKGAQEQTPRGNKIWGATLPSCRPGGRDVPPWHSAHSTGGVLGRDVGLMRHLVIGLIEDCLWTGTRQRHHHQISHHHLSETGNGVWGSPAWEQNHGPFEQQLFSLPMSAV